MAAFTYDLKNFDLLGSDDCPNLVEFSVSDGIDTLTFYTNKQGEGLFTKLGNEYRQCLGTCQFRLPQTKGGARKMLKRRFPELCRCAAVRI